MTFTILHGNNLDILPTLPDNSVDSIVTDPPYELGFMGKKWDSSGIAYSVELWTECLRVLKPGGHLLSFGGTRTYHRVAVAIEDAGFEIRDNIAWLYGSGFPKSLDVSKAIDKAAGVEREVVGTKMASPKGIKNAEERTDTLAGAYGGVPKEIDITAPATDEAKQWNGWGTALKPAHEPIIVARKPLIGTVAHNVLTHGTGALNIDGSRIGTTDNLNGGAYAIQGTEREDGWGMQRGQAGEYEQPKGRWPANIILDEHTAGLLDEQSGVSKSTDSVRNNSARQSNSFGASVNHTELGHLDSGGASRFFYVAKASKRDRNEGLEELEARTALEMTGRKEGSAGLVWKHDDGSDKANAYAGTSGSARQNFHPTVKPTALMEYLVKLVTPPNGTVLDPFTGSGSTGKAAILNGFDFIGIEMTEDYLPIIKARLQHAETEFAETHADKGLF
jgi:site-specific DNA-methyltransferase (adenine-specific)